MKALEQLEAILAAVTPLELVIGEDPVDVLDEKGDFFATTLAPECGVATQQDYDNARLIALMRNRLPALIECAKALEHLMAGAEAHNVCLGTATQHLAALAALAKLEETK